MDFKTALRILRRRWRTVVATALVALTTASVITALSPRVYESTAKVFVAPGETSPETTYAAAFFVSQRVKSYAELVQHRGLLEQVVKDENLEISPAELATKVRGTVPVDTVTVEVQALDNDPESARAIAQAVTEHLVAFVEDLETPEGSDAAQIRLVITTPAALNPAPVQPRPGLNLLIAAALGLLLGASLAMLRDVLDNTVTTSEDVEKAANAPVLSSVGLDKQATKQPLLTDVSGFSPRMEAFRMLRTNLQFLDLDNPPRSLVVTSATAGEGKTSTATNLAIALAQAGRRVLLVDGDLRRPQAGAILGLETSVGLTTVLVGRTGLQDTIQVHQPSGLHFLAGGPNPPNLTEVLQAKATRDLMAKLRDMYDNVIVDSPPLLPVADAAILATTTDGALLVASHGTTHRDELHTAAKRLTSVGARLYGVVVNMIPRRAGSRYDYYYYYYDEVSESESGSRTAPAPASNGGSRKKAD